MSGWCQVLLIIHEFIPLIESDPLVGICVKPSHDRNNFRLTGIEVVATTEIHYATEIEKAFSPVVNRLECTHV